MRDTVKAILDPVVEFLNQDNNESQELWNILTALRGPDNEDSILKSLTVARIRYAIGLKPMATQPNSFHLANNFGVVDGNPALAGPNGALISNLPLPNYADLKVVESYHFRDHVLNAINAINRTDVLKKENL